jgi:nucleotide sugar dehydrogenase
VNLLELPEEQISEMLRSGGLAVAVFGLGSVGLAVATAWLRAGARVVGVDVDVRKVEAIRSGRIPHPEEVVVRTLSESLRSSKFRVTTDGAEAVRSTHVADVIVPLVYVPGGPDFTPLDRAIEVIGRNMRRGYVVIVETSLPPLTTETRVRPALERLSGLRADEDFALIYSPERVLVGRAVEDIELRYPKIVSGVGRRSLKVGEALYTNIAKAGVLKVSSPRVAEFTKLAEGVYRDVNIALANELARLARALGVDFTEVISVANTQPYSHLHRPGAGVGGHCIPVYPKLLSWVAQLLGVHLELVEHARSINESQPLEIVHLLVEELGKLGYFPTSGVKVSILGLAYRGGVPIATNSPTYMIAENLLRLGYQVAIHDPLIETDSYLNSAGVRLSRDLREVLLGSVAAVVVTDHRDYSELTPCDLVELSGGKLVVVVDARDIMRDGPCCGVVYVGIGRGRKCEGTRKQGQSVGTRG